jgi:hypothetical protein
VRMLKLFFTQSFSFVSKRKIQTLLKKLYHNAKSQLDFLLTKLPFEFLVENRVAVLRSVGFVHRVLRIPQF